MAKTNKFVCPHCGKPIDAALFFAWRSKQLGEMTSEKKAKSSAENGKKGGRPKALKDDFELNVTKNGKQCKLRLVNDGGKQYHLYAVYPDGQQVRTKYQPKANDGFPDIKFLAVKNGFEKN